MNISQAVILAGGRGARLRPFTDNTPKPMVEIHNRPFLEYLIDLLKEEGIEEVVLLLGYKAEKIMEYFKDGKAHGVRIAYSVGSEEDETGTRIRNAGTLLHNHFLLMYCDNYWPLQKEALIEFHNKRNPLATMTVYTNTHGITKNNVHVDEEGYVTKYDRSRSEEGLNGVDLAFFIMGKGVLDYIPSENASFESEVLPRLIEERKLAGYRTDHRHFSIGTLERLPTMERFLAPRKIAFIDRDGVLNKKAPKAEYITTWEEFEFLPGAVEAMKLLTKNGYEVYVITNQAGIARGVMSEEDLKEIHTKMAEELEKAGAKIHGIYYCPHGWDEKCKCRKPEPGMIFRAVADHDINLKNAFFVGDDERDGETGKRAGVKTHILAEGETLLHYVEKLFSSV